MELLPNHSRMASWERITDGLSCARRDCQLTRDVESEVVIKRR
jgi:hypothetical protein